MHGPSSAQIRPNVLIVDDIPSNIQVLAEALKGDCEIYFATSGEAAMEIATNQRIDLILLDIMMPDVDGYELCRLLQLDTTLGDIPVIFVTAKTEIEDEAKGFEVGGVDYITKPIRPLIVRARVRAHLELKANRDRLRAMASMDRLTGLPNRPYFIEALARELARGRLEHRPTSLLLLGTRPFTRVQPASGSPGRRRRPCQVARRCRLNRSPARPHRALRRRPLRSALPRHRYRDRRNPGAHLLARIIALRIRRPSSTAAHLTASIGGVTLEAGLGSASGTGAEAVVKAARALLAKAKRNGRNQFWLEHLGQVA
jgi:PleD family two-component response regulator